MAAFNPTLRMFQNLKDGLIDLKQADTLDGIMLIPGVPAARIAEQREKFVTRPDDVFITTYPKCGTSWMQQIVKLIVNNGVETGVDTDVCVPWHEHMSLNEMESVPSPRVFKSHLPYRLMPGGGDPEKSKAKYISVVRNPKDLSLSTYNHMKKVAPSLVFSQEAHFDHFIQEKQFYGPFYDYFLGWWAHRDAPNILILTYEQMKRDTRTAVTTIANFLGYSLTDEIIDKIVTDTSFEKMKDNKTANKDAWNAVTDPSIKFMYKGTFGYWRNHLTAEQSARIDAIVAEKFAGSGLVFDYGDD